MEPPLLSSFTSRPHHEPLAGRKLFHRIFSDPPSHKTILVTGKFPVRPFVEKCHFVRHEKEGRTSPPGLRPTTLPLAISPKSYFIKIIVTSVSR